MAALIPAAIAIGGAVLSSRAKKKQANAQKAAGAAARAELEPFIAPGAEASQTIGNALGGGPGANEAFKQFQNSTGFQARLAAGSEAIVGNQATRGLLNSGSTLKRQTKFGQDLAQGGFNNFLSQLGGQANRGLTAASGGAEIISGTGRAAAKTSNEGDSDFLSGIGEAAQKGAAAYFGGGGFGGGG